MTDTTWTLHTDTNGPVVADGAIASSLPTFGAGRTVSLELFGIDDLALLRDYARYTNDNTTTTGVDIRGEPWYHETVHPRASYTSQLVRVEPGADIDVDSWWCLITDAEVATTPAGTNPRVTLYLYVIADDASTGDRTHVEDTYGAGLYADGQY